MRKIIIEPVGADDREFIEKVYCSTRRDEFAILDWTDDQLQVFLKMQLAVHVQIAVLLALATLAQGGCVMKGICNQTTRAPCADHSPPEVRIFLSWQGGSL